MSMGTMIACLGDSQKGHRPPQCSVRTNKEKRIEGKEGRKEWRKEGMKERGNKRGKEGMRERRKGKHKL